MEQSLAQEQAAEHHVRQLLKDSSQPIGVIHTAFDQLRQLSLATTFADFAHAEDHQTRLWQAHTDGKRFFHDCLADFRKRGNGRSVEMRQLAKLFKTWIKSSVQFYTAYIHKLNSTFGGIPELQAVAHQVKSGDDAGESSQMQLSPEQRAAVLASCHRTLIYIGDLWRYRPTEQLDEKPDFGPAIGYYGLANTLRPSSGLGHHQQAVVALEQRAHLRSIYHLYRGVVVDEPHPVAAKNLKLEFGKVNVAWEKGDLIPKSAPNDPDAAKRILVGWFVRMHSVCGKGQVFSSHAELEREVLSQLAAVVKKEPSMSQMTLMRMVMINLAAQYHAGLLFQEKQKTEAQQAFFYLFRLNIKTYTTLLQIFYDEIQSLPKDVAEDEDLAKKLTPVMRRLLLALRLYSSWLTCNLHLVAGLVSDDFLGDVIETLWSTYARTIDVLADEDIFGVWALDDFNVAYMLEEDADTLGFKPLLDGQQVHKNWQAKEDGTPKPRFSDAGVVRMSEDEEMLARVKGLLDDGSYLAHEALAAPIGIVGDRIYYGQALQDAIAAAEEAKNRPPEPPKPKERPPPLSYAAAAKSGRAVGAAPRNTTNGGTPSTTSRSRQAQLTRMIDNLVDDDDGGSYPVTPPQQHVAHPAVVTNGEAPAPYNGLSYTAAHADFAGVTSYQPKAKPPHTNPVQVQSPGSMTVPTPPTLRTPRDTLTASSVERLQSVSVSKLWDNGGDTVMAEATSPFNFSSGLPTGTLTSPPHIARRTANGHSRVNSANSVRSHILGSGGGVGGDEWGFPESAQVSDAGANGYSAFSGASVASPLLFGAGGGIWSTPGQGMGTGRNGNVSPPGGVGG